MLEGVKYVNGFPIPAIFSDDNFHSAVAYKPKPRDLFLVTYPKCGTTWTGQILSLLLEKGEPLKNPSDSHLRAPFLEMAGAKAVENMPGIGPIKTHLPFHLTPRSKEAKYICVSRNPKDCCVSFFHHVKSLLGFDFKGTFDDFFELFIAGNMYWGDYFDHLLSWYPHRNESNVLFVTYEEIKEDFDAAVFKMASFIDDEKYAEPMRKDPKILENIKKYSSMKEMREFVSKSFVDVAKMDPEELSKSPLPDAMKELFLKARDSKDNKGDPESRMRQFVRKGIIGDWRNYFSEEQSRRLDEKFTEKTEGTDLLNLWKTYM